MKDHRNKARGSFIPKHLFRRDRLRWGVTLGAIMLLIAAWASPYFGSGNLTPGIISAEDSQAADNWGTNLVSADAAGSTNGYLADSSNVSSATNEISGGPNLSGTADNAASNNTVSNNGASNIADSNGGSLSDADAAQTALPTLAGTDEDIFVCLPLEGLPSIIRAYGYDYNPNTEDYRFHRGSDLAAAVGTPVYAVADGTVSESGEDSYWGGVVKISHGERWSSIYRCIIPAVAAGSSVKAGDLLGHVTPAPAEAVQESHLHLELELSGESQDAASLLPGLLP